MVKSIFSFLKKGPTSFSVVFPQIWMARSATQKKRRYKFGNFLGKTGNFLKITGGLGPSSKSLYSKNGGDPPS